ncbi:MAG TPA: sugar transferase [Candidatus Polarisedimenticolia bacterium]|jgi:lipopolysaccharide/colanic/teichoic acid biosynthesis glycosyltransferase
MIASGATQYRRPIFQALLAFADAAVVCAALWVSVAARDRMEQVSVLPTPAQDPPSALRLVILAVIFIAVYAAMGLYSIRHAWESASLGLCVSVASAAATGLFLACCYLAQDHSTSRFVIGLLWILSAASTWLLRLAARETVNWCSRKGLGVKRVVVVGDDAVAESICRLIQEHPHAGLSLAGRAVPHEGALGPGTALTRATLDEVAAELLRCAPHRVLFTADIAQHEELQGLAERCLAHNIEVLQVPRLHHAYPGQVVCRELMGMPLLGFGNHGLDGWELLFKEIVDRTVSCLGLLVLSPALALTALAVRLSTGGPALRRERRAGRGGVPFTLLSFETCVERGGRRRPTILGGYMLSLGLDRLPLLLNVVRGDLSLVGPRADTPEGLRRLNDWQRSRLSVKPGITGLAQIRREGSRGDPTEMVREDLRYIESQSLLFDLRILVKTAVLMVSRALRSSMAIGIRAIQGKGTGLPSPARAPGRLGPSDGAMS